MEMGAKFQTLYGLSGMGDLIVTCASVHSRNRKAGYLMGQGYTMDEAMKEVKMVVEGVYSAKAAKQLSEKYQVEMPIVDEINKVLFEGKSAKDAVRDLMLRDKKVEGPGGFLGREIENPYLLYILYVIHSEKEIKEEKSHFAGENSVQNGFFVSFGLKFKMVRRANLPVRERREDSD